METENSTGDQTNMSNGDTTSAKNPYRRVKVYMLNSDRAWDDKGTGHVSCAYIERLQGMALIVRSEEEDSSIILESKVCPTTAYQKQQDTLICWSENEQELALSFQLIDSCSEIWEKICDIQGRDPGDSSGQEDSLQDSRDEEHFDDNYANSLLIDLPAVEMSRLAEIQTLFNEQTLHGTGVQWRMEKLAASIETDNYINKLLDLFTMCDDLENIEALHQLFTIFKTIFMLNKNALFDVMFNSENLMKVVGVLEFDASKPERIKHRDFLENQAKYHSVVPIQNEALLDKIHQTYRVQYIQDVILPTPSVFDENTLSALNSFIFFNKCEIVKTLQEDIKLMKSLFHQLTDDETDDNVRKYLIKFLKEFCNFSSTLQAAERDQFFQMLCDMHLFEAIETLWNLDDADIISTTNDVFAFIVEANPGMVREFCLSEAKIGNDELLVIRAIEQMQKDFDPEQGGAVLLSATIRVLVDPENMLPVGTGATALRSEKSEFLNYFYQHCIPVLILPLKTLSKDSLPDDYSTAQLLNLTIELLTFCAEHHSYQFRTMLIRQSLLKRILHLLKSRHAFLALCAVRLLRKLIALKEAEYYRHIVSEGHLKMICEAFISNGDKYNLFNSAVIELFESIRVDSIKVLAREFVLSCYSMGFQNVEYVQTFKLLKEQFSSSNDGLTGTDEHSDGLTVSGIQTDRYRRDSNTFDEDEENWFEQDDENSGSVTPPLEMTDELKITGAPFPSEDKNVTSLTNFPKSIKRGRDEDDDLPFGNSPRLQRTISINLKSLISATDSPPLSPPNSTTLNAAVTTPPCSTTATSAPKLTEKLPIPALPIENRSLSPKFPLVDYPDEDSDEETEVDSSASPKRAKLAS